MTKQLECRIHKNSCLADKTDMLSDKNNKNKKYTNFRNYDIMPNDKIPLYIKKTGKGNLKCCKLSQADYIYVASSHNNYIQRMCGIYGIMQIKGENNMTHLYVSKHVNLKVLNEYYMFGLSMTYHGKPLIGVPITKFQMVSSVMGVTSETMNFKKSTAQSNDTIRWLLSDEPKPPSKISGPHMRFIQMRDIRTYINLIKLYNNCPKVFNAIKSWSDATESFLVGIILYLESLRPDIAWCVANSPIWSAKSTEQWFDLTKNRVLKFKALQHHYDLTYTELFEMEVLINRGTGNMDWKKEILNRTSDIKLTKISLEEAFKQAVKLFQQCKRNAPERTKKFRSWDEFVSTRYEWVPLGAVFVADNEYKDSISTNNLERTKLHTLCNLTDNEIKTFLTKKARNEAKPQVKYEWGKQRAVYSSDLVNFVVTSFAMYGCEDIFDSRFPVGAASEPSIVKERVSRILQDGNSYCLDFEDFNSQHSVEVMQGVLIAYKQVFQSELSSEQVKALDWVIDSVAAQVIVYDNKKYPINGTLFSGWRLTSFMNTVCNWVYSSEVLDERPYLTSVHNGDDTLMSVQYVSDLIRLSQHYEEKGIRVQHTKSFLGGIGEFLRVDHKLDTKGSQYLARGITTLTHGRVEMSEINKPLNSLQAFIIRLNEVEDRGMPNELVTKIKDRYLDFLDKNDLIKKEVSDIYLNSHVLVGGMRTDQLASVDYTIIKKPIQKSIDKKDQESMALFKKRYLRGISSYAQWLKTKFDLTEKERGDLAHTYIKDLYKASNIEPESVQVIETEDLEVKRFHRCLYKRDAKRFKVDRGFTVSRLVRRPLSVLINEVKGELEIVLSSEKDIIKALDILV